MKKKRRMKAKSVVQLTANIVRLEALSHSTHEKILLSIAKYHYRELLKRYIAKGLI